jgi:hypothetical protein
MLGRVYVLVTVPLSFAVKEVLWEKLWEEKIRRVEIKIKAKEKKLQKYSFSRNCFFELRLKTSPQPSPKERELKIFISPLSFGEGLGVRFLGVRFFKLPKFTRISDFYKLYF